jgi:hypothetical protein
MQGMLVCIFEGTLCPQLGLPMEVRLCVTKVFDGLFTATLAGNANAQRGLQCSA